MTIRKVLEDSQYRANVQIWELFSVEFYRDNVWDDVAGDWEWKAKYRLRFKGWVDAVGAADGGTELKQIEVEYNGEVDDGTFPIDALDWDAMRQKAYALLSTFPGHENFAEGAPGIPGEVVAWVFD